MYVCAYITNHTNTNTNHYDSYDNNTYMHTVGFHYFNLRIVNLRVSNPDKLIVFFLTRCGISMCQGLGPKEHDEISEIDPKP